MFTGIIQAVGTLRSTTKVGGDLRLEIDTAKLDLSSTELGDSIAVNGVCLTAVELSGNTFAADVSQETLKLTSLGGLNVGSKVNLEKALTLSTPLGGHLVSGHVDGLATLVRRYAEARSERFLFALPDELARYVAAKGSICIDGVSLTVNEIDGNEFNVNIVPHTQEKTIICDYQAGSKVNIEVDVIARYTERLLDKRLLGNDSQPSDNLMATLEAAGFTQ